MIFRDIPDKNTLENKDTRSTTFKTVVTTCGLRKEVLLEVGIQGGHGTPEMF